MAVIKLENDEISVGIDELGAQMISLVDKNTGKEYMWGRDPKFWGKCSLSLPAMNLVLKKTLAA